MDHHICFEIQEVAGKAEEREAFPTFCLQAEQGCLASALCTPPGSLPSPLRSPRALCQAPSSGPRRPASSHFCIQGPLSPARDRNVPMSSKQGHLHSAGWRRTSSPHTSLWSSGCCLTPTGAAQGLAAELLLFLKVYFQEMGPTSGGSR